MLKKFSSYHKELYKWSKFCSYKLAFVNKVPKAFNKLGKEWQAYLIIEDRALYKIQI